MTSALSDHDGDLELLKRWRAGERGAGGRLVGRHDELLRRFFTLQTSLQDVGDLTQQVWVAALTIRELDIRATFRAYLLGIARHTLLAYIRHRSRGAAVDPITSSIAAMNTPPSQALERRSVSQRLLAALEVLPTKVRLLLELRYFDELSTAELACMYDVPLGTIKSRLSCAREQLQQAMRKVGPRSA